jgi:site-specific recombinase XerD
MSHNPNSTVQASVWLKPDSLDALRTAVYRCRPDYLQERDNTILTLMSDTGVRVGELVAIDTDHRKHSWRARCERRPMQTDLTRSV